MVSFKFIELANKRALIGRCCEPFAYCIGDKGKGLRLASGATLEAEEDHAVFELDVSDQEEEEVNALGKVGLRDLRPALRTMKETAGNTLEDRLAYLSSVLGVDGTSWKYNRPCGVAFAFQVRKHRVECHADDPNNIFCHNETRS